jgi:hypothetical protein
LSGAPWTCPTFRQLCGYSRNTKTGLARASGDLIDGHLDPNAIFGLGRVFDLGV